MIDITAQLILDHLSQRWSIQFYGKKPMGGLKMPLLYSAQLPPEPGRVYVSSQECLPQPGDFPGDCLVICTARQLHWSYTKGKFPVIRVETEELWEVFNLVQQVFDRHNQWACQLDGIIEKDANIIAMVRCSLPILENGIAILDRDLYHLAFTGIDEKHPADMAKWTVYQSPPLSAEKIEMYKNIMESHTMYRDIYSAYAGTHTLNLYIGQRLEGYITIGENHHPLRKSDYDLFHFFARRVERALVRHVDYADSNINSLRQVFQELLARKPVSSNRLRQVRNRYQLRADQSCICIVLYRNTDRRDFPVRYICNMLEKLLEGCVAMEFEPCITAIVSLPDDSGLTPGQMDKLERFLLETGFQAGISYVFSQLRYAATYYHQACSAYEIGVEQTPGRVCYPFREFALPYMLYHSVGDFSAYSLCPRELLALREKSNASGVDYWSTLELYLDNNLNIAQTARDLYLHRSSLLGRLERIQEILGRSLDNPELQLEYRLIMHLFRLELGNGS